MKKSVTKHHIYTFVVGKKISALLLAALIAAFALSLGSAIFADTESLYTKLYAGCNHFFASAGNKPLTSHTLDLVAPETRTVMQTAAPIFGIAPVQAEIQADSAGSQPESKQSVVKSTTLTEKNIKSENLSVKNETSYEFDPNSLVNEEVKYDARGNEAKVLVLHTHACESYSDKNGNGLGEAGTYRSTDNNKNMVKIGAKLTALLTQKGISAIHDKTQCDYPSYNDSYKKSLGLADWYINKYPSLNFIFDIHRDAITDENQNPTKLIYNTNGKKAAQVMIVCGTDGLGLHHPNWRDNLTLAVKIQAYLEKNYPGFARPINLRKERFNMHMTKGSLIFEIGTHGNTMEEALLSTEILSEAIAAVIL